MQEYRIGVVTDASGDSTDYTECPVFGRLIMVHINDGDLVDNWDMTFSYTNSVGDTITLLTLTNKSADTTVYPREQVHGNTGTGLTLDGTRLMVEPPIVAGAVKVVTSDGGVTKSGSILLYIE